VRGGALAHRHPVQAHVPSMRRLCYVKADVAAHAGLPLAPLPSALFVSPLFGSSVHVGVHPAKCCNLAPVLALERVELGRARSHSDRDVRQSDAFRTSILSVSLNAPCATAFHS